MLPVFLGPEQSSLNVFLTCTSDFEFLFGDVVKEVTSERVVPLFVIVS